MRDASTYPRKRYGDWAGNPGGNKYDPAKCAKEVWPASGWISYQCSRKPGHGPRQLFCKQHAKEFADEDAAV